MSSQSSHIPDLREDEVAYTETSLHTILDGMAAHG
jgi:hypothetical protein